MAHKGSSLNDFSVIITGILLGLTLPPGLPLWMAAVGAFIAVAPGKMIFGGLGFNVFNPALVGRAFLQAAFPVAMTHYTQVLAPHRFTQFIPSTLAAPFLKPLDTITGATPLMLQKFDHITTDSWTLFLGERAGSSGETCAILILLCGLYLIARKMMDWRIPAAMLLGALLTGAAYHLSNPARYPGPFFILFSGGLMLGAMFMATDPVASPVTPRGMWIYGLLMGLITVLIRFEGGLPKASCIRSSSATRSTAHRQSHPAPHLWRTKTQGGYAMTPVPAQTPGFRMVRLSAPSPSSAESSSSAPTSPPPPASATAPTSAAVGATYAVTATGGASGNPVTFTIDGASTAGACTLSGSTVSFAGAGTCLVDANQAGNTNYASASQIQQSITVGKASQTIVFTSTAPTHATIGGATYAVTATGGASGNPVTFTIDGASTAGACTLSGSTVSFAGVGTCLVDANQAGNANYAAAAQVQQSITVGKASQTIAFTSTAPTSAAVGATYAVTATGGASGNPVTFTIDGASTAGACTLSGSTVSFAGAGTCLVDANQAGNTNYASASQIQQSITVGKASQTIVFTSTAPTHATIGGATYAVTATGGASGNPVTFTIDGASTAGVCTLSGSTVSFAGVGTCLVDANQAGNANYAAAAQVQQSITVGKASQTIAFTSAAPTSAAVGGATYAVSATGGASGNPVTFTIDGASTAGACTISGSTVSFTGAGTCLVDANQAGNANYAAASQIQQSITVGKASQTIVFTSTTPTHAAVGGATYAVTATGGASGNPVTFTIDGASTAAPVRSPALPSASPAPGLASSTPIRRELRTMPPRLKFSSRSPSARRARRSRSRRPRREGRQSVQT